MTASTIPLTRPVALALWKSRDTLPPDVLRQVTRELCLPPPPEAPAVDARGWPLPAFPDDDDRPRGRWLVGAAVAGAILLGVTAWWAFPARSQPPEVWSAGPGRSTVTLRPTTAPGAVAEVLFWNSSGDPSREVHRFDLGGHGFEAELGDAAPDTLRVTPADGFIAVPPELTIPDGSSGIVLIYSRDGVGM